MSVILARTKTNTTKAKAAIFRIIWTKPFTLSTTLTLNKEQISNIVQSKISAKTSTIISILSSKLFHGLRVFTTLQTT